MHTRGAIESEVRRHCLRVNIDLADRLATQAPACYDRLMAIDRRFSPLVRGCIRVAIRSCIKRSTLPVNCSLARGDGSWCAVADAETSLLQERVVLALLAGGPRLRMITPFQPDWVARLKPDFQVFISRLEPPEDVKCV